MQNNRFITTGFAITATAHSEVGNSPLGKCTGFPPSQEKLREIFQWCAGELIYSIRLAFWIKNLRKRVDHNMFLPFK